MDEDELVIDDKDNHRDRRNSEQVNPDCLKVDPTVKFAKSKKILKNAVLRKIEKKEYASREQPPRSDQ